MPAAAAAILDGMPDARDLHRLDTGGQTMIFAGSVQLFWYAEDDTATRNVAVAVLRQLGFGGEQVAAVMELTPNYVATLRQRSLREGTAGLVRPAGRPRETGEASWDQARAWRGGGGRGGGVGARGGGEQSTGGWRAAGTRDAEIARRLGVNQSTVLRRLGRAHVQEALPLAPEPAAAEPGASEPRRRDAGRRDRAAAGSEPVHGAAPAGPGARAGGAAARAGAGRCRAGTRGTPGHGAGRSSRDGARLPPPGPAAGDFLLPVCGGDAAARVLRAGRRRDGAR